MAQALPNANLDGQLEFFGEVGKAPVRRDTSHPGAGRHAAARVGAAVQLLARRRQGVIAGEPVVVDAGSAVAVIIDPFADADEAIRQSGWDPVWREPGRAGRDCRPRRPLWPQAALAQRRGVASAHSRASASRASSRAICW